MKKIYYVAVISVLILSSCKSEFGQFNELALSFASDRKIDQKEYENLLEQIARSDEKGFQQFKDDKGMINNVKVVSYLLKYFKAKKNELTLSDIWQPEIEIAKTDLFNVNVFLENSGSMNGYLDDPNTQFKNSVYSLLTRLKLFVDKDSLNLFFINKDDQLLFKNATNDDVEKFKDILNPTSFKKISSGKTSESDLNSLISRCIKKSNEKNLSVFISDCIYSPGKKHPDASQYLTEQKQGIYLDFATELRERDLSVIVLQVYANFKGTYWDKHDFPISIPIAIRRPFYIWFIGSSNQIGKIIKSKKLEELDGGYENMIVFQKITRPTEPNYKILYRPRIGEFDSKLLAQKIITNASMSTENQTKGLFGFYVAVDFSNSLQNSSYFIDTTNYNLSDSKYQFKVETISNKVDPSLSGYTHLLKMQTTELREETIKIDVIGNMPSWVYNSNSNDDSNIAKDTSEEQKTFGLKSLMQGVTDAFYPKTNLNSINSISIIIKK